MGLQKFIFQFVFSICNFFNKKFLTKIFNILFGMKLKIKHKKCFNFLHFFKNKMNKNKVCSIQKKNFSYMFSSPLMDICYYRMLPDTSDSFHHSQAKRAINSPTSHAVYLKWKNETLLRRFCEKRMKSKHTRRKNDENGDGEGKWIPSSTMFDFSCIYSSSESKRMKRRKENPFGESVIKVTTRISSFSTFLKSEKQEKAKSREITAKNPNDMVRSRRIENASDVIEV